MDSNFALGELATKEHEKITKEEKENLSTDEHR
jgi:hypothetical protein